MKRKKEKAMDMHSMLTTAEKRRLTIVETLLERKTWVDLDELAKIASCSTKTLGTDFQFFDMTWQEYFVVEFSRKSGVRIHVNHERKMNCIYGETLQNSQFFQFAEMLFFKPYETGSYWLSELFISESSLYRMVQTLNGSMEQVGIEIIRQPFYLQAKDERWLRLHFTNYFDQAYGIGRWPFKEFQQEPIVRMIGEIAKKLNMRLSDEVVFNHSLSVGVAFVRMSQGFRLELNDKKNHEIDEYILGYEEEIQEILPFRLPTDWHKELAQMIFHPYYGWDNEQEMARINGYVSDYLDVISKEVGLELVEEDRAAVQFEVVSLYTKYKIFPYVRYSLFDNLKFQAERVFENYPNFSREIVGNLQLMEKRTHFPWYSKMLYHIIDILFVEWSDLPIKLEKRRTKVKMLIVSTHGQTHAKILKGILDMQFHYRVEMEIYEGSVMNKKTFPNAESYDVIISTEPLLEFAREKLFVVDNIPNVIQLGEIAKEIDRLQLKLHVGTPKK